MVRRELCQEFNRILIGIFFFYVNEIFNRVKLHGFVCRNSFIDAICSLFRLALRSVAFNGFRIYIFLFGFHFQLAEPSIDGDRVPVADSHREIRYRKRQIYGLAVNNLYVSHRVNTLGIHNPNRCQSRFVKKIRKSYDRIMVGFAYTSFALFFAFNLRFSSIFELGSTKYRKRLADNNGRIHVVETVENTT